MRGARESTDEQKESKNFCSGGVGFGVFSFCEKEAGKFSAAQSNRLRSRPDSPKKAQTAEKGMRTTEKGTRTRVRRPANCHAACRCVHHL